MASTIIVLLLFLLLFLFIADAELQRYLALAKEQDAAEDIKLRSMYSAMMNKKTNASTKTE